MKIKDLFSNNIERDIQGVVKVGQTTEEEILTELKEYVVTKELKLHFSDFFSAYKKGFLGETDKMGVWISGFFGSGKSHFLKILSYILDNEEINGKKAVDYFKEGKIDDPMLIADMEMASNVPSDVILFNIDSKTDSTGVKTKESILSVFLKVFNEKLGYSSNPHLAQLERNLETANLYGLFKEKFEQKNGRNWIEERSKFNFIRGKVQDTLVSIGFMSERDAELWGESTVGDFMMSIEDFALMIKEYIDSKETNHHLIFLVDEIGQYVGDDTDLMLNLQTITEDLGRICKGKAWVVVTSQQDIDSLTKVKGNDFSKIQGRFDTRLNLTSANVDEVIKLRILRKNAVATDSLKIEYENNETIIKNLIIFNDTVEKKHYKNSVDFAEVYPFIPYHFDVLPLVLNSIRRHSSSGKHLSEGERSMLSFFQQSLVTIKDQDIGTLVPFDLFYNALERFLDHSHAIVIKKAIDSNKINSKGEKNPFNVKVLKTLFMIKYVNEIEPNIDNITTLLVSSVHEDRRALKDKVQESLTVLESQMLIQKHMNKYIFLTDEEQEINREIQKQPVEETEIIKEIQEILFNDIVLDNRVSLKDYKNRYTFLFERFVDDIPYGITRGANLSVKFITPTHKIHNLDGTLRAFSLQETGTVYVNMGEDSAFREQISSILKVSKFLAYSHSRDLPRFQEIIAKKRNEIKEGRENALFLLKENLNYASFYSNNNVTELSGSNFNQKLMEQLEKRALEVYNKLNYITSPMEENDIRKLISKGKKPTNELMADFIPNQQAANEVLEVIQIRTRSSKMTMKDITNTFQSPPYGYGETDIQWLVTKLYVDGSISLNYSGENLSLDKTSVNDHIDYICKTKSAEKLLIAVKQEIPNNYKQSLSKVVLNLFRRQISFNDMDATLASLKDDIQKELSTTKNIQMMYDLKKYPGRSFVENYRSHLINVEVIQDSNQIYEYIDKNANQILDDFEDYELVHNFFYGGTQIEHWEKSLSIVELFQDENVFLDGDVLQDVVLKINAILESDNPFSLISSLPNLNNEFEKEYKNIAENLKQPLYRSLHESKEIVVNQTESMLRDNQDFLKLIEIHFSKLEKDIRFERRLRSLSSYDSQIEIKMNQLLENLNQKVIDEKNTENVEEGIKILNPLKIKPIKEIAASSQWEVSSLKDLDRYLDNLRQKVEDELEKSEKIIIRL